MERTELIKARVSKFKDEFGLDKLVAVTKYTDDESVNAAYLAGVRNFGESRVSDLIRRAETFKQDGFVDINWHFIGHVQSNKVSKLLTVPNLKYVHSIDSLKLLDIFLEKSTEQLGVFFQVKTTDESEKSGASIEELDEMVKRYVLGLDRKKLDLIGLMTIGKVRTETFEADARKSFVMLRDVALKLEKRYEIPSLKLSMGMSDDYKIALSCGSNFVRIGSAIFD